MIKKESLRDNIWSILFFLLLLVLTSVMILLINTLRDEEPEISNLVGAVFIGSVEDGGWNESHYRGLLSACEELDLELKAVENVSETEEACREAVEEIADEGASVIFLTSDGFGDNVRSVIEDYPDIFFYTISPESKPKNVTTYYGRMYQMRYLSGIIAGKATESNVLGYVAAMSNAQVDRGVNAFLLGARSVNPEVKVKLRMIGAWYDSEAEEAAAQELIEEGADVLTHHTAFPSSVEVAERKGIKSIGYSCLYPDYSDNFLASLAFHWDVLYKAILRDYLKGGAPRGTSYWWGTRESAVALESISPLVDEDTLDLIDEVHKSFDDGYDVFLGEIRSADGELKCMENERISDEGLLFDMNWFVEGVEVAAE